MEKSHPYGSYSIITALYLILFSILAALVRRTDTADEKVSGSGLLLIGLATFRLSRLISHDRVTQYLRAPFVEVGKGSEQVEGTQEEPRGEGLQQAIGQLLTCTYCSSVWAATINSALYLVSPRIGRFFLLIMAGSGIAELLDPVFPLLSYLSGYINKEEQIEARIIEQPQVLHADHP